MLFQSNSADSDTAQDMATTRTAWHFAGDAARMPVWKQALTGAGRSNRMLVKICTGLSLLLILFTWFDISAILENLFAIDAYFVLLAMGIFVLQFALSCVRWVYILGRQHLSIGSRSALSIYGAGTLANLFLVTSIAGVRSGRIAGAQRHRAVRRSYVYHRGADRGDGRSWDLRCRGAGVHFP